MYQTPKTQPVILDPGDKGKEKDLRGYFISFGFEKHIHCW